MLFSVLGPFKVCDQAGPLHLGGPVRAKLVCRLLLASPSPVPASLLETDMWDGQRRPGAAATLRSHIAALRRVIGQDRILREEGGYRLVVNEGELDAEKFQWLLDNAVALSQAGEVEKASGLLMEALALWRGPALGDLSGLVWAQPYATRLNEARLEAIVTLLYCDLALGRDHDALALARAELDAWPGHTDLITALMVALYRCGYEVQATEVFWDHHEAMKKRGLLVSPRLHQLQQAILSHDESIAAGAVGLGRLKGGPRPRAVTRQARSARVLEALAARRFVGREKELGSLSGLLERAAEGEGLQTVLVRGEPGIGKSALLAQFEQRAREEGFVACYGCAAEVGGLPLMPVVSAFRDFLHQANEAKVDLRQRCGHYPGELARLVPELSEHLPGLVAPMTSTNTDLQRWRLFEAVASWLAAMGGGRPAVVALDDFQWADRASTDLVRHLHRSGGLRGVVLVVAYRTEAHDRLLSLSVELARPPEAMCLDLGGLSLHEVSTLCGEGPGARPAGQAAELWRRTSGNPFYVTELLAHLPPAEPRPGAASLPRTVTEAVAMRAHGLGREVGRVLATASLVETEFDTRVIASALHKAEPSVVAYLAEASQAGWVLEAGPHKWRFAHDIVREALAAGWSVHATVEVHRRIVEAIARHAPTDHKALWAHSSRAQLSDAEVASHAERAGDQAMAALAYEDAASWYQEALARIALAGGKPTPKACELMVRQGEAAKAAGQAEHRELLLAAGKLAAELEEPSLMARAALANGRGGWSFAGLVDRERIASLEQAIRASSELPLGQQARLLAALAGELVFTPQRPHRYELARRALAMARELGDDAVFVDVACTATIAIWEAPLAAEFRAVAQEALAPVLRLGDKRRLFEVYRRRYLGALDAGHVGDAEDLVEEMSRLAAELGEPTVRWYATMFGATIAMLHAELRGAESLIEEARRLGQSGPGTVDGDVWYLVQLMLLRYQQGRLGELVPALETLYRDFPLLPAIKAGLALALVEAGEPARAQELLSESAARGFQDHPSIDCTWLCYLACYAEVAWSLECTSHAQQLYNSLLPYRELAVACGIVFYGSVEYYLGALAACMGSSPKAHEHLSAALRLHRKWAAPYWEERAAQKLLLAR